MVIYFALWRYSGRMEKVVQRDYLPVLTHFICKIMVIYHIVIILQLI